MNRAKEFKRLRQISIKDLTEKEGERLLQFLKEDEIKEVARDEIINI